MRTPENDWRAFVALSQSVRRLSSRAVFSCLGHPRTLHRPRVLVVVVVAVLTVLVTAACFCCVAVIYVFVAVVAVVVVVVGVATPFLFLLVFAPPAALRPLWPADQYHDTYLHGMGDTLFFRAMLPCMRVVLTGSPNCPLPLQSYFVL